MPIAIPPWVLAPEFTWRSRQLTGAGVVAQLVPANPTRVMFNITGQNAAIIIGTSQNMQVNSMQVAQGATPFIVHFDTYGGAVCAEWFWDGSSQFFVFEVFWQPSVASRMKGK